MRIGKHVENFWPVRLMQIEVIQAEQDGPPGLHKKIIQFGRRQLQFCRDFLICRRASESVQEFGMCALQQRDALVNRPGNPIHRANFIQHGAPNTELRIGFELRFTIRVVLIHRIHQSNDADRHKILRVHIGGKAIGQAIGHRLHDMRELFDDQFALRVGHWSDVPASLRR